MARKIQTSINLTPEIKNIIDTEGLNLSAFVEDQLEKYFSVSSIQEVDKKILEHESAIGALKRKRADLLKEGVKETKHEAVKGNQWDHAFDVAKIRLDSPTGETGFQLWVKHAKACEPLLRGGMQIDEVVSKLLERYDGIQKGQEKEV